MTESALVKHHLVLEKLVVEEGVRCALGFFFALIGKLVLKVCVNTVPEHILVEPE